MATETVTSDATRMMRTVAARRGGGGPLINSDVHPSLFTFLQFKHSLRNRRAKDGGSPPKVSEWGRYFWRKKKKMMMIIRTQTTTEMVPEGVPKGERRMEEESLAPVGAKAGREECGGPSPALAWPSLDVLFRGISREIFSVGTTGSNPVEVRTRSPRRWKTVSSGCPLHRRDSRRSVGEKGSPLDPARTCGKSTAMGSGDSISRLRGRSFERKPFSRTTIDKSRGATESLSCPCVSKKYTGGVVHRKVGYTGADRRCRRRCHRGMQRSACLFLSFLAFLCHPALATLSVSISPLLSSSPSSRTLYSSSPSSLSDSSSVSPSSSPRPSSSLSVLPTPWPSPRGTPSTATGPPPPPWEDDPCGDGVGEAGATAFDQDGIASSVGGGGDSRGGASPWLRAEVTHENFEVNALVPGLVYGVSLEWSPGVQMRRLVVTSRVDGAPSGTFSGSTGGGRRGRPSAPGIISCTGGATVGSEGLRGRSSYAINWTLPAAGSEVILRISYLPLAWDPMLTESAVATAASDLSMGVVTQSLRLLSACDLTLSKLWGTLSWRDIEPASSAFGGGDCTVHFSTPPPPPPSSGLEPMGLLVDLTRLNVACSLGHLQFGPSARHVYCGKLEEYHTSERQVHLRGGETPFLRVHSRGKVVGVLGTSGKGRKPPSSWPTSPLPVPPHSQRLQVSFSLRYRPVEPCYNVTMSSRNGSLLIPPPPPSSPLLPPFRQPSDRVRCTLAVHLPYGYKVSLRLRVLGTAAASSSGAGSLEAAEEREEEELSRWSGGVEEERRRKERLARRESEACPAGVLVGAWEEGPWWNKCLTPEAGVATETSEGNRVILRVYWGGEEEKQHDDNELSSEVDVAPSPPSLLLEYAAVEVEAIVRGCDFGWVSLGTRGTAEVGRWGTGNRRKRRWVESGMSEGSGGYQGRRSTCVGAVETDPLPWGAAETECVRLGGHLASVRSEEEQAILDTMLTRSPGYSQHNSYWVGASDVVREGDFRWTDGAEFSYSNWFPGWASHGHYNRQPNDDGLSGQDCVELRRAYQLPSAPPPPQSAHRPRLAKVSPRPRPAWTAPIPGDVGGGGGGGGGGEDVPPHRLSATHAWNDRDCLAANYYVCEREAPQTPRGGEGGTGGGGRKEEDGVGDPSAPDSDDESGMEGAAGGREGNERGGGGSGGTREGSPGRPSGGGGRHHDCNREIRLGGAAKEGGASSVEGGRRGGEVGGGGAEEEEGGVRGSTVLMAGAAATTTIVTSPNFPAPYPDDVRCDTVVIAPPGYRLLLEFEELVLEDEPTCSYDFLEILDLRPKGHQDTPEEDGSSSEDGAPSGGEEDMDDVGGESEEEGEGGRGGGGAASGVGSGRRLCGDWSSRLKLLRHVTLGRSLRLRFVSDYSHRFGGFRARVSMLSAATIECADNRLQTFNNSCYLFVGYPEVTWNTAQQICHGMKAELASVLSPSEYRFVTSSIRGSDQYSNSAVYWLGGKLEEQRSTGGKEVGEKERGGGKGEARNAKGGGEGAEGWGGEKAAGWHWVDGSLMDFQAWLPESTAGAFSDGSPPPPPPPLCLGVRWRQSPSPRLHPSGLHWSAEKCSTVGGYVCKRRKGWMGLETAAKGSPPTARDLSGEAERKGPGNNFPGESDQPTVSLASHPSPPSLHPTPRGGQEPWSPPLVMRDRVLKGESGVVTSPGFPDGYPPDVRALVRIVGPPRARLFLRFTALDLEDQPDCLYDYVEIREVREGGGAPTRAERWCGSHTTDLERFDFVSDTNAAEVFFRSDYSVSGAGFSAVWHAVDVSGCPSQTLAASSAAAGETTGVLTSPNHPTALMPRLDCTTTLLAPAGRHVWLEFSESEVVEGGAVELWLGATGRRPFRPFASVRTPEPSSAEAAPPPISPPSSTALRHLGDGIFLSTGNRMIVRLWTGDKPRGKGFKASFRAVDNANAEEHVILLGNNTHGPLLHLNYPDEPPPNIHFVQRLLAPLGYVVRIRLQDVAVSSSEGGNKTTPPPQANGTTTEAPPPATSGTTPSCESPPHLEVRDRYADTGGGSSWILCHSSGSVLSLTSYLNSLTVVQRPVPANMVTKDSPRLNAMVRVIVDPNYKMKLLRISEYEMRGKGSASGNGVVAPGTDGNKARGLESCHPNPCLHGGKCVGGGPGMLGRRTCQCKGHYTGLFCALTMCDLEPCVFGVCVLSGEGETGGRGFTCRCFSGYTGTTCDERPRPCADNPCEGRGDCMEKGPHSFVCRCHAWWEGTRCERRMLRIPYKPLSERMLHEPFWLGLITVTVVLGIIGLIWCAKRHFPEKLEKLLAEEADRSRHGVSASSSARDNLQSLGGPQPYGVAIEGSHHHHHHHQVHPGGPQLPCPPRSLFGRLGIRKPSLLSLTGGGGTSAQMQRPQLAQPTQSPPCPNTPAVPDRKPNAPSLPIPPPTAHHGSRNGTQHNLPSSSSSASSSAARTFSLDDLLKLPPRRSPSSRKKRNNSSPTRKHSATPSGAAAAAAAVMAEAEKKKILQSLVTPAHKSILTTAARLSITSNSPSETLALGECPPNSQDISTNVSETKFMGEGGAGGSSGEDIVLEESLPGPPLMPPVPPTASRLDKKVTFARLLSRVSAEMGSSSASCSGSEATAMPRTSQETPSTNPDAVPNQHLSSPASDESSSVSSSTSSSSYHAMASSGASPAAPRKSSRTKIQVPVVDALGREGITSTRGPSILLEPPSSSMCNIDLPPLSPIREMPSPSPSPTRVGLYQSREEGSAVADGRGKGVDDDDDGDTDDVEEEEEEEEEPARVCVTQSPEEEGGGDGGGGDGGEEEEEDGEDGEDDEGDEDDDEDDEETEDDEEDEEDDEEQEGKAEEDHVHQKQRSFSLDAAALEATDDDIGDEGLEEDSPTGMDTMSETTTTAEKCSLPRLVPPLLSLPSQPVVIPTITVQQPSPTKAMTPNTRPHLVLPIGSPPPRRRLSEHHPYPPPIFFQPPLSPQVSQPSNKRLLLHGPDKPTSLDLPMSPPVITVTATMSESDETEDGCTGGNGRCGNSPYRSSGSGNIGPGGRRIGDDSLKCGGQPGMTYLSPFSMCSRGERTASESNLSSSGYSSMASPGPSRAGSNNPLCPSDVTDAEDPHQHLGGGHPHHGPHLLLPHHRTGQFLHPHHGAAGPTTTLLHPSVQHHHQHYLNTPQGVGNNGQNSPTCSDHDAGTPHLSVPSAYSWTRRPSPLLQTPNMEDATVERPPGSPPMAKSIVLRQPQADGGESAREEFERSSGEEEEEVEGGEVGEGRGWRRREERRNSSTTPDSNDEGIGTEGETGKAASATQKTLQLPSIVVGVRGSSPPPVEPEQGTASRLSPVSSRSESPLSDRMSLPSSSPFGHHSSPRPFSALFFGKGPPLPLTDSDALYDCPSSEVLGGDDSSTGGHTTQTKGLPPGFGLPSSCLLTGTVSGKGSNLLEVPHRQGGLQRKISPKRRVRAPVPICSSSSSSSSLEGIHSKRPSTSSTFVQQSSRCSSSSDKNASKSIEVPFTAAIQSPTKLPHYQPRKYKHLRGWISPGATDQKKCFEASLSPHGLSNITHSSNASSSSTATTPLPHDDVNVTGDTAPEIIGKESKWIYGPDKIALHEALMIPLAGQDPLPQTRKICRMKTIGHQIRFLRRLELTLKRRERLVSPSDSDEGPQKGEEDDEHDRKEDSSQSSSETTKVPLLPTSLPRGTKESRYRSSFRRQRRAYERTGRGTKTSAPVLEPLLHQLPISTSSEDEDEKPSSHSSPYRQRHINLPPSIANTPTIGVTTVPNINR